MALATPDWRLRRTVIFIQNVGVPSTYLQPYYLLLKTNRSQFKKFDVTREVLATLNEQTEKMLGVRRKFLQSIVEFDSFETCYPNDKDRAKANVSDIQKIVKLKDTVTKYENYLSREQSEKIQEKQKVIDKLCQSRKHFVDLEQRFAQLFSIQNPQERGKKLEQVLNDIFMYFKIGIKEDFVIYDDEREKEPLGVDKVARFMSRLLVRKNVDGIIVSYASFTETAILTAKEALSISVLALVDLKDIYDVLNQKKDIGDFFSELIKNVKLYKNPKPRIDISGLKNIDFNYYD